MKSKRYQALLQERADLVNEQTALFDGAGERALSADEAARDDAIDARLKELEGEIQREERRIANALSVASTPNGDALVARPGAVVGSAAVPQIMGKPWGFDLVGDYRQIADPKAKRLAMEIGLGDQLAAIVRAGRGLGIDPRLIQAAASGGNTSIPSDGGFMVQTDFSLMLFDRAMETAVLAPRCLQVEIGPNADGVEMPYVDETNRANGSRWGGVRVYRRAEADTVTATKPTLDLFELRLADLMGLAYLTDRAMADAASLGQLYAKAFVSEFAFKVDDEIVRGTGVGECLGILNATPVVSVAKETGQDADTVVYENVVKMHARLLPRSRARAAWLINVEVEPQLQLMSLGVGTAGVPVYLPPGGASAAPFGTLFGKPVIPIEQAEELGTTGDIMLVDLDRYMLIRKGAVEFAESMHVRFIYGENTLRWTQRINGRPIDKDVITPYQGANTLAPFVKLDTRS